MQSTSLPTQDRTLLRLLWSVVFGAIVGGMNSTLVATVLPALVRAFHQPYDVAQWLASIYTLVQAVLVLPMGRLSDQIGQARVFRIGVWLFFATSAAAALAPSFPLLLGLRALQAVAGSMIMASVPAWLALRYPPDQRGRALGTFAMAVYIGLSFGPLVGGFLVARWGWPGAFWINLPLLAASLLLLPRSHPAPATQPVRVDGWGSVLLALTLGGGLLGWSQGLGHGWTVAAIGEVVASAVAGILFVRLELGHPDPLLDVRLFAHPAVRNGNLAVLLNYVAMFFFYLLVPAWLAETAHVGLSRIGLVMTVTPVVMLGISRWAGGWSDRRGTRLPTTLGLLIFAAGLGWIAHWPDRPLWLLVPPLLTIGIGLGLFTAPIQSAVLGATPRHRQGMMAGTLGAVRYVGQALGVAIAGALYTAWSKPPGSGAGAFSAVLMVATGLALLGAWAAYRTTPGRLASRPLAEAAGD